MAVIFQVPQRRDALLARLATSGCEQKHWEPLDLATDSSAGALIQQDEYVQNPAEEGFHHRGLQGGMAKSG